MMQWTFRNSPIRLIWSAAVRWLLWSGLCCLLVVSVALMPGLPWATHCQYVLKKGVTRTRLQLARWSGLNPQLVTLYGKIDRPNAVVEVLDSPSGWASLTNESGEFQLPEEWCYPGATIDLLVTDPNRPPQVCSVAVPDNRTGRGFHLGPISLQTASIINEPDILGRNSISQLKYDVENDGYYRRLFEKLTEGKASSAEKIDALNIFVAAKLNFDESTAEFSSPRQMLERGSKFCGPLAIAMATLAQAGGYPARVLHLRNAGATSNFHAVVEVYYDQAWHVYDATYGIKFLNDTGSVASYEQLRHQSHLITPEIVKALIPKARRSAFAWTPDPSNSLYVFLVEPREFEGIEIWMPDIYASGMHHLFYFDQSGGKAGGN
ncbi:MAG: transglutaminase domain-containing protein [Acidobacteria bacterium]|nr:transglutaminase domain-containing protein [Acidobacteriota bacterium]